MSGQKHNESLSSAGIGVRFSLSAWISGSLEIAKPLEEQVSAEEDSDFRFFAKLIVRY